MLLSTDAREFVNGLPVIRQPPRRYQRVAARGRYLVARSLINCPSLPSPLTWCHACGYEIEPSRHPLKIRVQRLIPDSRPFCDSGCAVCEARDSILDLGLLIWIGKSFSPVGVKNEISSLGACLRIQTLPEWLVLGRTLVFLAHSRGMTSGLELGCDPEPQQAVILCVRPDEYQVALTREMAYDRAMVDNLSASGATPVVMADPEQLPLLGAI